MPYNTRRNTFRHGASSALDLPRRRTPQATGHTGSTGGPIRTTTGRHGGREHGGGSRGCSLSGPWTRWGGGSVATRHGGRGGMGRFECTHRVGIGADPPDETCEAPIGHVDPRRGGRGGWRRGASGAPVRQGGGRGLRLREGWHRRGRRRPWCPRTPDSAGGSASRSSG